MGLFTKAKDDLEPPVVDDVSRETLEIDPPEIAPPVDLEPPVVDDVSRETLEIDPVEQLTDANNRLHSALVALDGRLANPDDLPFDPAHLADDAALKAAISALIESRPGLKKNHVAGDVGQGARGDNKRGADLIELMKMA